MDAWTGCDACPARANTRITLIPSMGILTLCGHHARSVVSGLEASGAEFEAVDHTTVEV